MVSVFKHGGSLGSLTVIISFRHLPEEGLYSRQSVHFLAANKVVDSRDSLEGASIRRRRECIKCKRRFTTYEYIEEMPLMVIKKDGRREPFDRKKIISGLNPGNCSDVNNVSKRLHGELLFHFNQVWMGL